MTKAPIIALCGSSVADRAAATEALASLLPAHVDLTIPKSVRVPWGREERLAAVLASADRMTPILISIACLEEADVVESLGGEVVHVQGLPSDDIPIERHHLMMTLAEERGRYTNPVNTLIKILGRAA
ncbi:hypothetical protein [Aeromonas aquatica]|uniref:hypothetical protein n=1 Tax=Aeromonas aquatica TaxID=558964 RepID=UPI00051AE3DF|nr:hypothetical protein [Aeromonas aquatica]